MQDFNTHRWRCTGCGANNMLQSLACHFCGAPRPVVQPASPPTQPHRVSAQASYALASQQSAPTPRRVRIPWPIWTAMGMLLMAFLLGFVMLSIKLRPVSGASSASGSSSRSSGTAPALSEGEEATIRWSANISLGATGMFLNKTKAPLPDVRIETVVRSLDTRQGFTVGTKAETRSALWDLNGSIQDHQRSGRHDPITYYDMGGPGQPERAFESVTVQPGEVWAFLLPHAGSTFPLDIRVTSAGREISVKQTLAAEP